MRVRLFGLMLFTAIVGMEATRADEWRTPVEESY